MRRGPPLLFAPLRCAHKRGAPRLWFSEGNSNCRSRERVIVAEHTPRDVVVEVHAGLLPDPPLRYQVIEERLQILPSGLIFGAIEFHA